MASSDPRETSRGPKSFHMLQAAKGAFPKGRPQRTEPSTCSSSPCILLHQRSLGSSRIPLEGFVFDPEDHRDFLQISSGAPHKGCSQCTELPAAGTAGIFSPSPWQKHLGHPPPHPKALPFQSCIICRAEVQAPTAPAAPLPKPPEGAVTPCPFYTVPNQDVCSHFIRNHVLCCVKPCPQRHKEQDPKPFPTP